METLRVNFQDIIVHKPWGQEYLVYENEQVALWLLYIKKNESTSLHCHPLKTTGMVLLSGEVELSFLADKRILNAPAKAMIRRGLFHSTKALSKAGAYLFEIETPNDKLDLIRLDDIYGREDLGYETSISHIKKNSDSLMISAPKNLEIDSYNVNGVNFEVFRVNSLSKFISCRNDDIYIFLTGGVGKYVDCPWRCSLREHFKQNCKANGFCFRRYISIKVRKL
jgi:mannose-6-phosphate isomerase-like protein (cupin superfamily)